MNYIIWYAQVEKKRGHYRLINWTLKDKIKRILNHDTNISIFRQVNQF